MRGEKPRPFSTVLVRRLQGRQFISPSPVFKKKLGDDLLGKLHWDTKTN